VVRSRTRGIKLTVMPAELRDACELHLDACVDARERELARTIKTRIGAAFRGDTRSLSMTEVWKAVEDRRSERARVRGLTGSAT